MKRYLIISMVLVWVFHSTLLAQEEKALYTLDKHTAPVLCVAWSPDGKLLATGSEDKTILIWDATNGNLLYNLGSSHLRKIMALAFTPDGKKLISAGDRTLVIWTREGIKEKVLGNTTVDIWSISISDDGKYIAAASYDKKIHVFNLLTGTPLPPLQGHQSSALAVCFTHNNKQLISGSLDETIKIWDLDSSKAIKTLKGHSGNIYSIDMAENSDYFVSASKDNSIRLWSLTSDKSVRTFQAAQPIMSVSLARNGRWLLSGSIDNTVVLRETATGNKIYSYIGFKGGINAVAFSPNGEYFAVASGENQCRIFRTNPDLFVDYYFQKEATDELNASPLYAPKGNDEARTDYKLRQDKAAEFRKQVYAKYYERYLENLRGQKFE
ncbi:MAG: WD40 repeat domain-containing protein [Bacteroidales bacterium]